MKSFASLAPRSSLLASVVVRFSLLASLVFLGAGCASMMPSTPVVPMASDSGTPSPEGLIAFSQGFGLLPGKNPMTVNRPVSTVSVNLENLPEYPSGITVIRKRSTMPNATVLQNISAATHIPIGTLEQNPKAKALTFEWQDSSGYRWKYDAQTDRLEFEKDTTVSLTTSKPLSDDVLLQVSSGFFKNRGLLSGDWGSPYTVFSWQKWWEDRMKENKCMSRSSIEVIRKMALESSLDFDLLSSLSSKDSSDCVDPEFPNLQVVRFSISKDGEMVFDRDGSAAIGAEAVVRMDTQEIVRGWVEIKREADRSNYLAIQPDRLEAYLKSGGISGFPTSAKSFEAKKFNKGSYRYIAPVEDEKRTFYIPAIQAEGTLMYENGTSIPYAVVVPLTREDQFEGK